MTRTQVDDKSENMPAGATTSRCHAARRFVRFAPITRLRFFSDSFEPATC
jgi:hypothetical protein